MIPNLYFSSPDAPMRVKRLGKYTVAAFNPSGCNCLTASNARRPLVCAVCTDDGASFQDFTDYAKYYFDSVDFSNNEYFTKIEQSDIDVLNEHLDDFESWIETYREGDASRDIVVNYDFDRSFIDGADYLYINSEKHTWDDGYTSLVNYDVYFFDTQTNTLYYFHNNT